MTSTITIAGAGNARSKPSLDQDLVFGTQLIRDLIRSHPRSFGVDSLGDGGITVGRAAPLTVLVYQSLVLMIIHVHGYFFSFFFLLS